MTRVGLRWSRSREARPKRKPSEPETVYGSAHFSDLPSPEEGIFESVHAGQRKVEQPVLGTLIPMLPVVPEPAVGVCRGIRLDTTQVEAAVVEAITVLSGKSDTETRLTRQSPSTSRTNREAMTAYMVFIMGFQAVQACPGQIPPILPSGAVTFTGSALGLPPNAK